MADPVEAGAARRPSVSIVVPAHNEAPVIGSTLRTLLSGTAPGEFDVVVVANACTDDTAQQARAAGVRVVETPVGGKVGAIHLGDRECYAFPRIYLDADVALDAPSARALVNALAQPGVLAAAPVGQLNLDGVGWCARRIHRVHERLIAPRRGLAGVGVYAVNAAGHQRVFPLPPVISDDGYVHGSFAPGERVVVAGAYSVIRPARTVRAHLRRRVRVRLGNRQLAGLGRAAAEGRLGANALVALVRSRAVSPLDALCYLGVLALDRVLTRLRRGRTDWGSDASSRRPGREAGGQDETPAGRAKAAS